MIGRRSFFGALLAGAAVPAAVGAATPDRAVALDYVQPICPSCCNVQRIPPPYEFETRAAWVEYMTTPHEIVCGNEQCQLPMIVTFARRAV